MCCEWLVASRVRSMARAAGARVTYWVIVPERHTDVTVQALRHSWLRGLPPSDVEYCVANGSDSRDPSLHSLPLTRRDDTPTTREQFYAKGQVLDVWAKEAYNGFLRRKVFMMVQQMAKAATAQPARLDYAFLLDADTAVNVSNLRRFVDAIPGAGGRHAYTGRCLQEALDAPRAVWMDGARRTDIARFIVLSERYRRLGRTLPWDDRLPPSPGGGPGILLSRGLLANVSGARLDTCEPLTLPFGMGTGSFAGGDSMLTRCFATLGVRCSTERDLGFAPVGGAGAAAAACPFAHGCALTSLFRKNPPWLYHAVSRHIAGRKSVRAEMEKFDGLGLDSPLYDTIAFHHVRPSLRAGGLRPDPRCAIRLRADMGAQARWWSSSCIPSFCFVGAPRSGTLALLGATLAHSDVVPPSRRTLRFFTKPQLAAAAARSTSATFLSRLVATYSDLFPSIDPRDFRLTGEATPTYFYSPLAASFFASPNLRLARLVLLLRNPTTRTLSALERDASVPSTDVVERAFAAFRRCGAERLYAGCVQGHAFAAAGQRDAPPREGCASSELQDVTAPPALWQSFYHLFLPTWLAASAGRLLVLFSEIVEREPARTFVPRLHAFIGLPAPQPEATHSPPAAHGATPLLQPLPPPNVSRTTLSRLHLLLAPSVQLLDAQLQAARRSNAAAESSRALPGAFEWLPDGVPTEWKRQVNE